LIVWALLWEVVSNYAVKQCPMPVAVGLAKFKAEPIRKAGDVA